MCLRILLTVLSTLLFNLCFPDGRFPHLAWIAMVPWFLALRGAAPGTGFLLGLLYGLAGWFSSIWWLAGGVENWFHYGAVASWLIAFSFCVYHAAAYAVFGFLHGVFQWPDKRFGAPAASACLTVLVCLSPAVPGNITHSLYNQPLFIQLLDLGGVSLLFFVIALVNWLSADLIRWKLRKEKFIPVVISLVLIFAFVCGYGKFRLDELNAMEKNAPGEHTVRIAAVQPNLPLGPDYHDRSRTQMGIFKSAVARTREIMLQDKQIDLAVWPEIPLPVGCQCGIQKQAGFVDVVRQTGRPLIIGCQETGPGKKPLFFNAAMLIEKDGGCGAGYRKRILVPFSEYLPYEREFSFLRRIFKRGASYSRGTDAVVMDIGRGRRIIPSICYEATFSHTIRDGARLGGNIIVNMVDDAWFGENDASLIHMSLALFRSVEYRMPYVRATNSGVGVFVRATGEIVPGSITPLFKTAATIHTLYVPQKRSPYFHLGDAFLYFLLFGLLTGLAVRMLRRIPALSRRKAIPGKQ